MRKFLYEKNVYNYLVLLTELGVEKYNDLREKQEELLSLLIVNSLGSDIYDILNLEEDDLSPNSESKEKILHHVYKYLQNNIDDMLSEIIDTQLNDYRRNNGLNSFSSKQTGEINWRL